MKMRILNLRLFIVILTNITVIQVNAQVRQWSSKPIAIKTRWADMVKPENPLSEYPRPQMVRDNWINLNGLWNYAITPLNANKPLQFDGNILVPFPIESSLSGVKAKLLPDQVLWYSRTFLKPRLNPNERLILHFGAVDWQTTVFVNNIEVGIHTGGYTSFDFDITDAVRQDSNELVVKVFDPTDEGYGPHGKQALYPENIYYTASSGIWQTVWLEKVSDVYIKSIKVTSDIDKSVAELNLNLSSNKDLAEYSLVVEVKEGKKTIVNRTFQCTDPIRFSVKNQKLWSVDTPFLYDLRVTLFRKKSRIDEVQTYFGMRKIKIAKDENGYERIFLNNKYTYNLGVLDQGFWPEGLYTAPTDEALAFDIKMSKAMGFNTIRKHIKIEPDRWYYHADKLGVLVWQDFVNPNQRLPNGSKEAFEVDLKETINQLYNHPSIVLWVIFNEKWGQFEQRRVTELVRRFDSTRIVNSHSGEMLYVNGVLSSPSPNPYDASDLTDVHSYPYPRNPMNLNGKAKVIGEFGGIGVPVEWHIWDDLVDGWGYDGVSSSARLKNQYSAMTDSLVALQKNGLAASIFTQPYDVESEQNGFMTYDRKIVKMNIDTIAWINSQILKVDRSHVAAMSRYSNVMDTSIEKYSDKLNDFRKGVMDSARIRNFALSANRMRDTVLTNEILHTYFELIKDPFADDNLKLFAHCTNTEEYYSFKFIIKNIERIRITSSGNIAIETMKRILRKNINAKIKSASKHEFNIIRNDARNKYGDIGDQIALEEIALLFFTHKEVSEFVSTKEEILKAYPSSISNYTMNSDAWFIFQNATDEQKRELEVGLKWIKNVTKEDPKNAWYLDTQANILYRLGNVKEAMSIQELALNAQPDNEEVKKNYENMRKGIPTWK